ncbi:MAG: hypothetical protein FK733_10380 [Asgard group archaeon]|nr:hypothetical protein [Asgard group archaeon]
MDTTQMYVEKFCNSLHVQMKPLNIVQVIDQKLIDKHGKNDINQGLLQLHAFIDSIYSKMSEEPEFFLIPDYFTDDTQKSKDKKEVETRISNVLTIVFGIGTLGSLTKRGENYSLTLEATDFESFCEEAKIENGLEIIEAFEVVGLNIKKGEKIKITNVVKDKLLLGLKLFSDICLLYTKNRIKIPVEFLLADFSIMKDSAKKLKVPDATIKSVISHIDYEAAEFFMEVDKILSKKDYKTKIKCNDYVQGLWTVTYTHSETKDKACSYQIEIPDLIKFEIAGEKITDPTLDKKDEYMKSLQKHLKA